MKIYPNSIHNLHQARLKGELSTVDIANAVIKRVQTLDPKLNSYLENCFDTCLAQAKQADQNIQAKTTISPIAGMPIAIKDIFNIKGLKTTCASKILAGYISPYESSVTQKLKDAGYGLIGKTNLDEFAMGSSNETSCFGAVHNPWDLKRVPGGSSGGSAAAVAGGLALAALGTDTGGSIRQPAAFCGLVGLKPTYGRVSRYGMVAFASSFDQAGTLTMDVEDAALILQVISGADANDATSLQTPVPDFSAALHQPIKGLKVGVIKDLNLEDCHNAVQQSFQDSLSVLQAGGAELVEINLPSLKYAIAVYYVLAPSEASSNLGRYDGVRYGHRAQSKNLDELYELSREEGFGDEVKLRILIGTFVLSSGYYDAYYLKAQAVQNLIRQEYANAFKTVDVIISPTTPTAAFGIGELSNPLDLYLQDQFTVGANLAGIPAISAPADFTEQGLPIGVHFLANHLEEQKLLQVAHWFEKNRNLQRPELPIEKDMS